MYFPDCSEHAENAVYEFGQATARGDVRVLKSLPVLPVVSHLSRFSGFLSLSLSR